MSDENPVDDDENVAPTEQPTVDASSKRQYNRRKLSQKLAEKEGARFWESVFADQTGRREMWQLLQQASTFDTRFACGPNGFPQAEATWFNAGQQDWGLRLYQTWLVRYPEGVRLMHLENDTRFQKRKDG